MPYKILLLIVFSTCFWVLRAEGQMPVCASGLVYYIANGSIYNYDPSQPISSTNPSLNTISAPTGANGLAVCDNLNASSPSPTFYTAYNSNFYYYNGSGWTNTGHTAGSQNLGGGGRFLYSIQGGSVYKYNGTGNASQVITLTGTYVPDIVADCSGNFYVLRTGSSPAFYKYDSSGALITSWAISGTLTTVNSIGLIGSTVYIGSSFVYSGALSTNLNFSLIGSLVYPSADFATCGCILCPGSVLTSVTNDTLCDGDTLYLSATASSISSTATYSWTGPNGFSSSLQSPVISGISSSATGNYVVSVSDTGTCVYTDSIHIVVNATPNISASSNSPLCPGDTLSLTVSGISGAAYQWSGPNNFSSTLQNPSISTFVMTDTGNYEIKVTTNGCSDSAVTHVMLYDPGTAIAGNNGPLCAGDSLKLTSSSTSTGGSYSWSGPNNFNSALQNPTIPNAQVSNSGTYIATVSLNNCSSSDSTIVIVNPTLGPPVVNISVSPDDTICAGDNITLTATSTNSGSAPIYQWRRNGLNITGATSAVFTTASVNNNDIITCKVTSNADCQAIDTAISSGIHMHVLLLAPPVVSITKYPLNYEPGDTVTFTGQVPAGNTGLSYQWTKNGVKIAGATTSTYTTANLNINDTICLIVYSSVPCTVPDSTITCVGLTPVSVSNEEMSMNSVRVYPNPNKGSFTISGILINTDEVKLEMMNMLGQVVYKDLLKIENGILNRQVNMEHKAAGVYMLMIRTENASKMNRIIIEP